MLKTIFWTRSLEQIHRILHLMSKQQLYKLPDVKQILLPISF